MMKILVVDDSAAMRQLVHNVLSEDGFDVVEAADGIAALDIVRESQDVEYVALDVNMPRMSGIELVQKLKADGYIDRGLKVVMLTTEGQIELIREAKAAGAKGWIVKPFKPELLLSAIRKIAA
ncbi:MAG: response regulator [Planctomycetota bacterium]